MSYQEENEQIAVLRQHNRALRNVNRQLRGLLKRTKDEADTAFVKLCEAPSEASSALEEIRTLGEIDCDPGDYDAIVERSLEALKKASHKLAPIDYLDV